MNSFELTINGVFLLLTPEKAVIQPKLNTMYVADTHFGKAGFYRDQGIAVPSSVTDSDYQKLDLLIEYHQISTIVFLGDLFHNYYNTEWEDFIHWRKTHSSVDMKLIEGNHDQLSEKLYQEASLKVFCEPHEFNGLVLAHYKERITKNKSIGLCGHVHPGIKLSGKGRQTLSLPCYYLSNNIITLPSFGRFTGLGMVQPKPDERFFVVTENKVLEV